MDLAWRQFQLKSGKKLDKKERKKQTLGNVMDCGARIWCGIETETALCYECGFSATYQFVRLYHFGGNALIAMSPLQTKVH